ncbi:MAG: hemerythrin domain-containing protein [Rhodomicrobium sp.]
MVDGKAGQHKEQRIGRLQPLGEAFLAVLERDQRRLLRLCAALEKVADDLPESRQSKRTGRLLAFLEKSFQRHIFLHEKCLFPLIRSLGGTKPSVEAVLFQLEFEHASDHGLVLEITSAFLNDRGAKEVNNVHVLGFLLRSFFENYRRHHSWEQNILYPIVRQQLQGETIAAQHDALLRVSMGLGNR